MKAVVDRGALVLLLLGTLGISTAYGMLLLLPIYITEIGGHESDFGIVSAAGAITSAFAIGFLVRYPSRFAPQHVLAATGLMYGLTAFGVSFLHSMGIVMIGLGVVLGTAWAMAYTSAPMVISAVVGDEVRGKYIGYVTGMIQVGFGLGPIVGNALLHAGMSFNSIFRIAALVSAVAAVSAMMLGTRLPELSRLPDGAQADDAPLWNSLRKILRSPAAVPLLAILLGACLFTTMNSFQGTFANNQGMNFDIFYGSYTIAVIVARFVLVRWIPDPTSSRVLRASTAGIVVSVLAFLAVGSNSLLYGTASTLLGITYGLALPAAQARAVNLSPPEFRTRMLPLAGLSFETAILAFPLVSGFVIKNFGYTIMFVMLLVFAVLLALTGFLQRTDQYSPPRQVSALDG
ncbi:MFS transporter [Streptomyces sp. NPDC050704]|uniref:MFS transporter n=1 Tax=Streptomyces sp. NPDC050704 TaxID=3157219 RepID=UPI0034497702